MPDALILDWNHPVATIPERGLETSRNATAEECDAARNALEVLACSRLRATYRIKSAGAGCYRVTGSFNAEITQACVATAEPVSAVINGEFEALFYPPGDERLAKGRDEMDDPFANVSVEPIANGVLDVGRVIYEEFASSLDPYPRADGSAFTWKDPSDTESAAARPNPFAKLAALKRPPPEQGA